MKKKVNWWQGCGFVFAMLAGTGLHYLYDWFGAAAWSLPFTGVNESTWEHMKLLFWPMFFFAVIQSFFFQAEDNFWCVKLRGTLLGLALIPLLFYTINGAIAKTPGWANILMFAVSAAGAYFYEKRLFDKGGPPCKRPMTAMTALVLIALCFVVFTFRAPHLNLFRDPVTGAYGV